MESAVTIGLDLASGGEGDVDPQEDEHGYKQTDDDYPDSVRHHPPQIVAPSGAIVFGKSSVQPRLKTTAAGQASIGAEMPNPALEITNQRLAPFWRGFL